MTEKYKKLIAAICILSAVSLVLSLILLWKNNIKDIDGISDTVILDDKIILSNNDDRNNISVIAIDSDGNEIYSADYSEEALNAVSVINSCEELIAYDGDIFAHIISYDSKNRLILKEQIMLCDFKSSSMKNKWDIPVNYNTGVNALNCRIINGKLYYVSVNGDTVSLNSLDDNNLHSEETAFRTNVSDITEWLITDDLKLIGYSSYKGILDFSGDSVKKLYPVDDNSDISIVNFGYDNENNIYFTDLIYGKNMKIDSEMNLSDNGDIEYSMPYTLINAQDYSSEKKGNVNFSCLKDISYDFGGNFSAVCDSDGERNKVAAFKNGTLMIFESINLKAVKYNKLFKYFLICFIVISIISSSFYFYYKRKRYISVPIKISLFSVIIMLAGVMMIRNNLEEALSKKFRQDIYSVMLADISSMRYDIENIIAYEYDKESISQLMSFAESSIQTDNIIAPLHYTFFEVDENGDFIAVNNDGGMENVPAEYIRSIKNIEEYRQSINNYTPSLITENKCYALIYPVYCEENTKDFIVEVSIEKNIYDKMVKRYTDIINTIIVICMALLTALFSCILKFKLKPIEILVAQIKNNSIKQEKINNNLFKDEIRDIKNVFENMTANISESQMKMKNNNETYYKFLPSEIFSIFKINNISELKSGDSQKIMFYNMYISLHNIDTDLLEKNYSYLLLKEEQSEYIIETFNMEYMEVSFRYKPENIVRHISEFVRKFGNIHIGISYGVSIMAILGGEKRLQAMIISKHKKIATVLSDISRRYGRNLMVSEHFLKTVPDYEKFFSVRYTGNICVDGEYIKIYDITDVSKDNDKVIYTKKDFEKGVNCFIKKDFYNAGLCFAEVLKYNRNDAIAKEYLNMSEIYLSGSVVPETDILSKQGGKIIETSK